MNSANKKDRSRKKKERGGIRRAPIFLERKGGGRRLISKPNWGGEGAVIVVVDESGLGEECDSRGGGLGSKPGRDDWFQGGAGGWGSEKDDILFGLSRVGSSEDGYA